MEATTETAIPELTVEAPPVAITTNFELIEAKLRETLEQYDIVVTADTVKSAKAQATEINKLREAIKRRRIDSVKEISAPITEFDQKGKALEALCIEARAKITEQVAKFEAERLEEAREKLTASMVNLYDQYEVAEEFRTASIDDIVSLGALTEKGNVTKAAGDKVALAVQECVSLQMRTELRLSNLENACHRAGLHSPLTREHVAGILFESDEVYTDRLDRMIDVELVRQEKAEKAAREKLEQEQAAAAAAPPVSDGFADAPPEPAEPSAAPAAPSVPQVSDQARAVRDAAAPAGQDIVEVQVVLRVGVPAGTDPEKVRGVTEQKLRQAGIHDSLFSIGAMTIASATDQAA
ncbi:MAG: DUF1351 domain-containing protein [Pseudomonadota bacterium]